MRGIELYLIIGYSILSILYIKVFLYQRTIRKIGKRFPVLNNVLDYLYPKSYKVMLTVSYFRYLLAIVLLYYNWLYAICCIVVWFAIVVFIPENSDWKNIIKAQGILKKSSLNIDIKRMIDEALYSILDEISPNYKKYRGLYKEYNSISFHSFLQKVNDAFIPNDITNCYKHLGKNTTDIYINETFKILENGYYNNLMSFLDVKSIAADYMINKDVELWYEILKYCIEVVLSGYKRYKTENGTEILRPMRGDGILLHYGNDYKNIGDYISMERVITFDLGLTKFAVINNLNNYGVNWDNSKEDEIYVSNFQVKNELRFDICFVLNRQDRVDRIDLYYHADLKYNLDIEYFEMESSLKRKCGTPVVLRNIFNEYLYSDAKAKTVWENGKNRLSLNIATTKHKRLIIIRMERMVG